MYGVGVGQSRGAEDVGEVAVARLPGRRADADILVGHEDVEGVGIRLGVDGNGADAELPTGADDAQCDFPAVGDENLFEHGLDSPQGQERLIVLNRVAVGREDLDDLTRGVRLDLVHDLHGLDDTEGLSRHNLLPGFREGVGLG